MIGGSSTGFRAPAPPAAPTPGRRHQTVSILQLSVGTGWSRGAAAGSAIAASTVTARIPADSSTDVTNDRRSMASFSSRKRYDAEDCQAQRGNASHELASSGWEAEIQTETLPMDVLSEYRLLRSAHLAGVNPYSPIFCARINLIRCFIMRQPSRRRVPHSALVSRVLPRSGLADYISRAGRSARASRF